MPNIQIGQKYWVLANWSAAGMIPHEVTWHGDHLDRMRVHDKRAFSTREEAMKALKERGLD